MYAADKDIALSTQDDWVPIREISRVTGVNTVTLRAWERRYGLLVPRRTEKGHRLYSRDDISRVQEIQRWLVRGLAIGKVKALLANTEREYELPPIDSVWLTLVAQFHTALGNFQRHSLERLIEETFALYPTEMLADYVVQPVLQTLQGDEPGKAAQRAFFTAVLQEYLVAGQQRLRQSAQHAGVVLVSVGANENPLLLHTLNYSLLVHQYQAECLGYLEWCDIQICTEALSAKILVIIGYENLNAGGLKLQLDVWRERSGIPVIVAGNLAQVFNALATDPGSGVLTCENHQQVLAAIKQLLKADQKG
ncbi:MerR family transcriptional regulator [Cellvibrio sp. pealriver]|uniref:MerR family transcriptional regulator n=1 Tax=Cellvibrio sp. pealriver TaxID=1622269 RepID=UPI00066FC911|nr:MerR family transcriptional regulator [Cellvibrio sp. pealriver]